MLKLQDLHKNLNPNLDEKRKQRFDVAFRSLEYQEDYCRYHYEQFRKELNLFERAMRGEAEENDILNPQYYRVAFEAHGFAFFRALHSLIESIPYLLNIILEVNKDSENKYLNWNNIIKHCETNQCNRQGLNFIKNLRSSVSYQELEHLVNVSKHRRIPRVDSGFFSLSSGPRFCVDDLDKQFRLYEIEVLMETLFDELHPQALEVIKSFVKN